MRGTGTATTTANDDPLAPSAGGVKRDASLVVGTYDMSVGVAKNKLVALWELGAGGVGVRTREMTASGTDRLTSDGDGIDFHTGLVLGYQAGRIDHFRIVPFVGIATDMLDIEDDTNAGTRYMIGVELEAILPKDKDFVGISARLGYAHFGSGNVYDDATSGNSNLEVGAILLQIGLWGFFDPSRKD